MENKFLSDKEIIENMKEYIDDTIYNRAILIDGAWGTGKTFFVRNKLMKELEEYERSKNNNSRKEKKIIYISLYGIDSTVDITNEIYLKSINIDKDTKIYSISKLGGKFLSDLMKNQGLDLTKYFNDTKSLIDISNCILIFDDLERCKCNINDILGYINNFVEHRSMKVIIVVNEEELGNTSDEKNIYIEKIKMKRAKKNKELVEEIFNYTNSKAEDESDKDTITSDKANKIEEYQRIKEKLIGTTIKYRPNLEESIKIIIEENVKDDNLRGLLINNISKFVSIAEENEHINLRTFQFFISKITKIYLWINDGNYWNKEEVLEELIKYTFMICIYYKAGIYMNEWKSNTLYGEISLEPYASDSNIGNLYPDKVVKGFRFIDDFVVYSKVCDRAMIDRSIQLFLDELMEIGHKDDPLNKLEYWYSLEDDVVENYIDEIYKLIKNKKYSPKRFPQILKFLNLMESLGFEKYNIEEDILTMMIKQVEECDLCIDYDERTVFIDDAKVIDTCERHIEKLKEAASKGNCNSNTENINKCLKNIDTWGSKLVSFYNSIEGEQQVVNGLLYKIDLDKLKYNIENSNTEQLFNFRRFLLSVYNNKYHIKQLRDDKDVINNLIVFVERIESISTSKTKRKNLQWLKENLTKIIEMMG